ncbi:MAG: DUF3800 domain-containing protein [Fuerstiella sp.]
MSDGQNQAPTFRHYFVDEAGDPNLFNKHGTPIVGKDGCSKFFMLGVADIADPQTVATELEELRERLLADAYFAGVPSFDPARRKTAIMFHAKDDLPEVRREVFALLARHEIRFHAVVRDKQVILDKVIEHQKSKATYKYHANQLYDRCVSRLFRDRLHKDDGYQIHFAKRGSSDRTESLQKALDAARQGFRQKWGVAATAPIEIKAGQPADVVCLQVVDYYLWAIQRLYERGEDRFLKLVWDQAGLVYDVDDTSEKPYGVFYTRDNPLTAESRA